MAKSQQRRSKNGTGAGMGVDASGGPVVDPTSNVLDLVDAAVKRTDDIMDLHGRVSHEQFRRLEEALGYQDRIAVLRAEFAKEIGTMESKRIDSIRSVDVANAAATAAQLLSAVTTLATTAQATAETLRNQVAATAAAVASQTERVVNPIIERIALLEKSSYTGQGRSTMQDPAFSELVAEMRKMSSNSDERRGRSSVADPAQTQALLDMKQLLLAQAASGGQRQGVDDSKKFITWILATALAILAAYTFTQSSRPQTAPVYVSPPATTNVPPQVPR